MVRAQLSASKTNKYDREFIFPRYGECFDNEDFDALFGGKWLLTETTSWLGREYEYLTAHKYRYIIFDPESKDNININIADYDTREIHGSVILLRDSEIDFEFLDIKGHTSDDYDYVRK